MEQQENTIDLSTFVKVLLVNLKWIILVTAISTAAAVCYASFFITEMYSASAKLYVENKQSSSEALNINDINAAQKLANTCAILFKSEHVMQKAIDDLQISYSVGQLQDMVSVSAINNTEIMQITATTANPILSADLVNHLLSVCSDEFERVIESGTMKIVDYASVNTAPVSPSIPKYGVLGFLFGFIVSYGIFVLIEMLDVKVKPEDDLFMMYNVPVFAEILNFDFDIEIKEKNSGGKGK